MAQSLIVIAVLAFLAIVVRALRVKPDGFREFVRQPEKWNEKVRSWEIAEQLASSETLSNEEIESCVIELLDRKKKDTAKLRLKHQGARIVPVVLNALRDDRYKEKRYGEGTLAGRPFFLLLELIAPFAPREIIATLGPLVGHAESEMRNEVALALAALGSEECIPFVNDVLNDTDEDVRSYAIIGINRAIENQRATPMFCNGVFNGVAECISLRLIPSDASTCLIKLNRARAIDLLLAEHYWNSVHRGMPEIITALNEARIPIQFARLSKLLSMLQLEKDSYTHSRTYGQVMMAMAASGNPEAESFIRRALNSENEHVCEMSAKALCQLRGVSNPNQIVFDQYKKVGFQKLSRAFQTFALVLTYDGEVNNGGHEQFFFNSSGNYAVQTVDALMAIGASITAEQLKRINALFGRNGPSPDRATRQRQLSKIADKIRDVCVRNRKELGTQSKPESITKLLYLFVAENSAEFGALG